MQNTGDERMEENNNSSNTDDQNRYKNGYK
jgi:hypothetical protein